MYIWFLKNVSTSILLCNSKLIIAGEAYCQDHLSTLFPNVLVIKQYLKIFFYGRFPRLSALAQLMLTLDGEQLG